MARPKTQSKGSAKRKAIAATQRREVGSKKKGGVPPRPAASAKASTKAKAAAKVPTKTSTKTPPRPAASAKAGAGKAGAGKAAPPPKRAKAPVKKALVKKAPPKAAKVKAQPKAPVKKALAKKAPPKAAKVKAQPKTPVKKAPPKAAKVKAFAKGQAPAKTKASPKAAGKAKAVGKPSAGTSSEQRTLPAIELAPPPRRGKLFRSDADQADASKAASAASGKRRRQAAAKSSKRATGEEAKPPIPRRKATRKRPPAPQQLELPVLSSPFADVRSPDERGAADPPPRFEPFALVETSPGNHSLLLTEFGPSTEVFASYGVEAGGYAWDSVARHLLEERAAHLRGRLGLDPESSMFCAYGNDAAALTELGSLLAALFHAPDALSSLIKSLGPDAFLD